MKSLFGPLIRGVKTPEEYEVKAHLSKNDKPLTPADLLTISRPVLAAKAASMLLRGKRGVTPVVAAMAGSDMEGVPARYIDKRWPGSGYGTTAHGAVVDPYADTGAILIVSGAALFAPRVTGGGKLAIGIALGQEVIKGQWALRSNSRFMTTVKEHRVALLGSLESAETEERRLACLELIGDLPKKLEMPASHNGKASMAEKLTAITLAVATNDFDNPFIRLGLTAGALYFASSGAINGEQARNQDYNPILDDMIEEHRAAAQQFLETSSSTV